MADQRLKSAFAKHSSERSIKKISARLTTGNRVGVTCLCTFVVMVLMVPLQDVGEEDLW